jgi:hypothetical protein
MVFFQMKNAATHLAAGLAPRVTGLFYFSKPA